MASEIRVNKINSRTGVGTITLSPTGVDFTGIATVATLKATTGIVTTLTVTGASTLNNDVTFIGTNYNAIWNKSDGELEFADDAKATFGTGGDLQIFHDGDNSFIKDAGTGRLTIAASQLQLTNAADSAVMIKATQADAVELYHNGSKKFETKSDGVDITGELQCDTLDVDGTANIQGSLTLQSDLLMGDNDLLKIGDSDDLQISHDGSTNIINGLYHPIELRHGSEVHVKCVDDGAVELYHNNSKKLHTNSGGVQVFGNLFAGDNAKHYFGDSNDLEIYHDGSNSFIKDTGTGALKLATSQLQITNAAVDELLIRATQNGSVELYYDNAKKFETKSDGVVVTGGIYLDGSGGTASANKLDDYEEGTWTPSINGASFTTAEGLYTKIGRQVLVQFNVATLSTSLSAADRNISGLPFTSANINQVGVSYIGDITGVTYDSGYGNIYGRINANVTAIQLLQKTNDGSTHTTAPALGTNLTLRGYAWYTV